MFEEFEENNKLEIAKIRYRIFAFLIDFFIYWLIALIIGIFFGEPTEGEIGFSLNGLPALFMFFVGFCMWPLAEGLFGKTIGKSLLSLKVVSDDFEDIGIGKALIRFLLGFIDYLFLIGIIIAATNKQKKRIGDLVAKTLVVKSK